MVTENPTPGLPYQHEMPAGLGIRIGVLKGPPKAVHGTRKFAMTAVIGVDCTYMLLDFQYKSEKNR